MDKVKETRNTVRYEAVAQDAAIRGPVYLEKEDLQGEIPGSIEITVNAG